MYFFFDLLIILFEYCEDGYRIHARSFFHFLKFAQKEICFILSFFFREDMVFKNWFNPQQFSFETIIFYLCFMKGLTITITGGRPPNHSNKIFFLLSFAPLNFKTPAKFFVWFFMFCVCKYLLQCKRSGVVANMPKCDIVVSKFEHQPRNYIQFQTNTLKKNIIIIIIIFSGHQHGYPWSSLATPPYRSSLLTGL